MTATVLNSASSVATDPVKTGPVKTGEIILRSGLPGRQRWEVPVIKHHPQLAAAVELVLRGEEGVITAQANSLTGRVLVKFDSQKVASPIDDLIRAAISYGPLSQAEMPDRKVMHTAFRSVLLGELGCVLVKSVFFSGGCGPVGAIAAAVMFFAFHRQR